MITLWLKTNWYQTYFADLTLRLKNQYELVFSFPLKGKPGIENLKLKARAGFEIDVPEKVFVDRATSTAQE